MAQERYGLAKPMTPVVEWVRDLVAAPALTDAYVGYGEAADFRFPDRLPPSTTPTASCRECRVWAPIQARRPRCRQW